MTRMQSFKAVGGASPDGRGAATVARIAGWLGLAASPTFAVMAVLTAVLGGGPMEMLCASAHGSPLDGMVPMYALMSAFHSPPWLKLVSAR